MNIHWSLWSNTILMCGASCMKHCLANLPTRVHNRSMSLDPFWETCGVLFWEYCFRRENSLSSAANAVSSAKKPVSLLWQTDKKAERNSLSSLSLSLELGERQKYPKPQLAGLQHSSFRWVVSINFATFTIPNRWQCELCCFGFGSTPARGLMRNPTHGQGCKSLFVFVSICSLSLAFPPLGLLIFVNSLSAEVIVFSHLFKPHFVDPPQCVSLSQPPCPKLVKHGQPPSHQSEIEHKLPQNLRKVGTGRKTVSRALFRQRELVLRKTRWVQLKTQRIGGRNFWARSLELGEGLKLTELGIWNRTLRNHMPVCEQGKKPQNHDGGYTPARNYCEINSENIISCNWIEIFHEKNSQNIFPCMSLNHKQIRVM